MGKMLGQMKNVSEADMGDLSLGEKMERGLLGGLQGGLIPTPPSQNRGSAAPIGIAPPPAIDFSQISAPKRNAFYGGY